MSQSFDQKELRNVLGSFLTGVTVVTATTPEGEKYGFTANSFTSVSLDPPLVLVCLANSSANFDVFSTNKSFAINILSEHQRSVSHTFATPVEDRFAGLVYRTEVSGSPVIDDCAAWLDCQMHKTVDAGDHIILIGEVVALGQQDVGPLGYYQGGYIDFGLGREAAIAAEAATRGYSVGALLESDDGILLVKGENGSLDLPAAHNLGGDDGLLEKLTAMGIDAEIGFLFSVFEDSDRGGTYTCYRGHASGNLEGDDAIWVEHENIPYARISDSAVRSMLQRYEEERKTDAFGVYMGDQDAGHVGKLSD